MLFSLTTVKRESFNSSEDTGSLSMLLSQDCRRGENTACYDRFMSKLQPNDTVAWSRHVAGLAVDALIDHGLVRIEDFDRAVSVAAEEINVRLCMTTLPQKSPR